ncbi:hypothetical protein BH09PSE2_BH09PSE2_19460 [soil metagenome]
MKPADRNRAARVEKLNISQRGSVSFFGSYTEAYREFGL